MTTLKNIINHGAFVNRVPCAATHILHTSEASLMMKGQEKSQKTVYYKNLNLSISQKVLSLNTITFGG